MIRVQQSSHRTITPLRKPCILSSLWPVSSPLLVEAGPFAQEAQRRQSRTLVLVSPGRLRDPSRCLSSASLGVCAVRGTSNDAAPCIGQTLCASRIADRDAVFSGVIPVSLPHASSEGHGALCPVMSEQRHAHSALHANKECGSGHRVHTVRRVEQGCADTFFFFFAGSPS